MKRIDWVWREIRVALLVCRDRRTPWYARVVALCSVGYVLSPVQLIPDFIPVLGLLDDAVVIAVGIALAYRWTPAAVLRECRERVAVGDDRRHAQHAAPPPLLATAVAWALATIVVGLWALLAVLGALAVFRLW